MSQVHERNNKSEESEKDAEGGDDETDIVVDQSCVRLPFTCGVGWAFCYLLERLTTGQYVTGFMEFVRL